MSSRSIADDAGADFYEEGNLGCRPSERAVAIQLDPNVTRYPSDDPPRAPLVPVLRPLGVERG
eukprot:11157666-Lingulodinium_polyedra.AAC.1